MMEDPEEFLEGGPASEITRSYALSLLLSHTQNRPTRTANLGQLSAVVGTAYSFDARASHSGNRLP